MIIFIAKKHTLSTTNYTKYLHRLTKTEESRISPLIAFLAEVSNRMKADTCSKCPAEQRKQGKLSQGKTNQRMSLLHQSRESSLSTMNFSMQLTVTVK